ncbi:2-Hydroxyacid oxidase 1-like [Glandiceps talaboti]
MEEENKMVCVDDFETYAKQKLPYISWAHYCSGAGCEVTLQNNRIAYERLFLKPRMLRDVSKRSLSTTILGSPVHAPICIAPTAYHGLAHPDAEVATAAAAANMNTIMIMSSISTKSMEEIIAAKPGGTKWLNIFIWPNREVMKDMVKRAERSGVKALVVSIDIPALGVKRRLEYVGGLSKIPNFRHGNLERYFPKLCGSKDKVAYELLFGDPAGTWEDITWLQTLTKLPIVLKGIMTVEDAVLAVKYGVQGILVSNHGGRQLDGVPATIDVLADIVQAVGDQLEVYLDGGIRQGTDVMKALALGARAVFIGRPILYGLTYKGTDGVKQVLQTLNEELSTAMALSGCTQISDITSSLIELNLLSSKL